MVLRSTVPALLFAFVVTVSSARADEAAPAKPSKAGADKDDAKKADGRNPTFDPDNKTAISRYVATIVKGNGKYLARDFAGALEVYRTAVPLAPKNPLGHYMIAEAQIGAGNLAEADASLVQAEANSDDRNVPLRARIMFLQADVKERQKKWDEAKAAWQTYGEYVKKHEGSGFPGTATSRTQAIDDMLKQEKAYVGVRERIAAERTAPPVTPSPTLPLPPPPTKK